MNAYSLSRLFIAWLTCLATLLFAPLLPAVEAEKAPPAAAEDNTLSIHIDDMLRPWRGDLPGMIDRRTIRVLTTYSKTFFFIDKGTQRGATHDIFIALENDLSAALGLKVSIAAKGAQSGQVVVAYADFEELDRICQALSNAR